jgi:phospholipid/cholesterol/gamma-HCH transport system substrate-binding protein
MDKTRKKNILLGLFVLVGLVLFIFGIFQVGAKNELFSKNFPISARFANATGLKNGSNVRFNGVNVGIVKAVNLINDTLVQVDMRIEENKRAFITTNAIAAIASDGLMGDKIVNITTFSKGGERITDNYVISSHNPINTDRVLQTLSESNENIKVITANLKTITSDLNSGNGPAQALYKDPEMTRNLKQAFSNLNLATDKVLTVSTALQKMTVQIQQGKGALGAVLYDTTIGKSLAYTLSNLKQTSKELNNSSAKLDTAMQHINSGKGTVNLLLTDTALASDIQKSMANIKNASAAMDLNMEALKHSIFLKRYFRKKAKGKL